MDVVQDFSSIKKAVDMDSRPIAWQSKARFEGAYAGLTTCLHTKEYAFISSRSSRETGHFEFYPDPSRPGGLDKLADE